MMYNPFVADYSDALAKAEKELQECVSQRQTLDARILNLRQVITALSALNGPTPNRDARLSAPSAITASLIPPSVDATIPAYSAFSMAFGGLSQLAGVGHQEGLTFSCRRILIVAGDYLGPVQVKERLDATGFDWSNYSQPLSAIHTVLKRLADKDQVHTKQDPEGKTVYKWKSARRQYGRYKRLAGKTADEIEGK